MKKLRKIIVDGQEYKWKYKYDDYDYCFPTYLLILPQFDRKSEIKIIFNKLLPPLNITTLNTGVKAIRYGSEVMINLNQPGFTVELLRHLLNNDIDFSKQKRYIFENGEELLNKLGYEFDLD